ncbi:hypothetical protein CFOL_v3_28685 [Cephalotus follicularis]|uniref:Transmembrane protein n=1 Tax=Cephalotus follicularis TaxID=3775 RepID=A0A1Q3CYD3_CEPFO|nr:hypothetical protein CFOL_v3_28685 [Cephalotus follicularis]
MVIMGFLLVMMVVVKDLMMDVGLVMNGGYGDKRWQWCVGEFDCGDEFGSSRFFVGLQNVCGCFYAFCVSRLWQLDCGDGDGGSFRVGCSGGLSYTDESTSRN